MSADVTDFGDGAGSDVVRLGPTAIKFTIGPIGAALVELPSRLPAAVFLDKTDINGQSFGMFDPSEPDSAQYLGAQASIDPGTGHFNVITDIGKFSFTAVGVCGNYSDGQFLPYQLKWTFRSGSCRLTGDSTKPVDAIYVFGRVGTPVTVKWGGAYE